MSLAVFALIASPLLAFLGVLVGQRTTRRGAVELERRRKREQTMRLPRGATELAVDHDQGRADVGITTPDELLTAPILDWEDHSIVASVTRAVSRTTIEQGTRGQPP